MNLPCKQAVCGIVFSPCRKEILLTKRRDIPVWVLPGGGLEQPETPEEATIRELQEETSCNISLTRKIALYTPVNKMTQLTHFYEAQITSGTPTPNSEASQISFFPLNSLPPLPPPYAHWIQDALLQTTLLEKPVEGVNYRTLFKLLILHPILVFRYLLTKVGLHLNTD